jgi:riboflavin synthase
MKEYANLIASKGSIAINGTSLTPVDVTENSFTVSVVTYTMEHTTLSEKETGSPVNIEFDILAKYVARHIRHKP